MPELYPFQQRVLEETKDKNRVAYYLDMGLGKTFVGSEKAISMDAEIILVVCQKSKIRDWIEHFFTYYIDKRKCDESGAWCYDLTDRNGLDYFNHSKYRIRIGIINYDLIFRRPELMNLENFTLMLDESSMIQNEQAKRSKFILKMHPKNVILLSGTPVSGKYEHLWSQIHLLGWNISKELYWNTYINSEWRDYGGGFLQREVIGYKNVERLKNKLKEYGSVFMKTDEVFDLPEQVWSDVKTSVSKDYKKFQKDKVLIMPDGTELVGDTVLTQMLYERELCGIYHAEKLKAFKDLVDSTNERLIVFYNFTAELEAMQKILMDDDFEAHKRFSVVNGQIRALQNYEDKENSITFIQYQAGAKGLNLQKANRIIYFTPPLSVENWMQSQKRIHRIGQKRTCFYYRMIVSGSVEQRIYKALQEGVDYTDALFLEDERMN